MGRFELPFKDLQSYALPLDDKTDRKESQISEFLREKWDLNPRLSSWEKETLQQSSFLFIKRILKSLLFKFKIQKNDEGANTASNTATVKA